MDNDDTGHVLEDVSKTCALEALDQQITLLQRYRTALQKKVPNKAQSDFSGAIEIIGGAGKLGQVFVKAFRQLGCKVHTFEQADWCAQTRRLQQADIVILCVPMHKTLEVIDALPQLSKTCILADFTSVKVPIVRAMCAAHEGPVIGLHPMFGPHTQTIAGQTVAVCKGQELSACEPLLNLLKALGLRLEQISAEEHDRAMGFIQALRHFNTFSDGVFLEKNAVDLTTLSHLSSPIYRFELSFVGRLFAQSPELYVDIILAGEKNYGLITAFAKHYTQLATLVQCQDRDALITLFEKTQTFLGDFAQQSLSASEPVLDNLSLRRDTP